MDKCIILVGQMATGKNTIMRKMKEEFGFSTPPQYTTRPKRNDKEDGVDYHFITDAEYEKMENEGLFASSFSVNTIYGLWKYGIPKEILLCGNVISVGARSAMQVMESGSPVSVILLHTDEDTVRARAIARGDDMKEVERRIHADAHLYEELQKRADFVVNTSGDLNRVWEDVKGILNSIYEKQDDVHTD